MLCWKFLRKTEGLCFKWLIQKWTQNIRQCFWTDVWGASLVAAILIAFGKCLMLLGVSQEEMETMLMWSPAFKNCLGETLFGKPGWCELKLGWRKRINSLCKPGEHSRERPEVSQELIKDAIDSFLWHLELQHWELEVEVNCVYSSPGIWCVQLTFVQRSGMTCSRFSNWVVMEMILYLHSKLLFLPHS